MEFSMAEYLNIQEVATLLRMSERRVYDLVRDDRIPGAAKVGGTWRIHRKTLEKFLSDGGDAASSKKTQQGGR